MISEEESLQQKISCKAAAYKGKTDYAFDCSELYGYLFWLAVLWLF